MPELPGKEFPVVLRRVWRLSDPATRAERRSDALDRPTLHQRFSTLRGDYWICSETGQLVREDFPDHASDLSGLYDSWWSDEIAAGPPPRADVERRKLFLKPLERYKRNRRLLEIGSGLGKLLRAAVECGFEAEGNELSPLAARYAEAFSGARVLVGPVEELDLDEGAYDVVLLNNVFEHLETPRAVLIKLARALRPGGVLYLQTLDAQSLSLYFNPRGWPHYLDGHLYVPTLVSLRHYFRAAGLRVASLATHGFSTGTGTKREKRSWLRKRTDKLVATVAGRLKLGHRVEAYLESGKA